ncbi:MAG: hypothetical protein FJX73_10120 [Armatimonadetes bacterium]|nr:hypothetical protein [Armatimonadota bacterium]
MRWVAIFEDNEGKESIRKEHSNAHYDYLAANRDKIVIAGGLRPAPDEWFCGGLWVMEVDSREEAVKLAESDPFFRLGLRKGYRLLAWGKAPCYDAVTL